MQNHMVVIQVELHHEHVYYRWNTKYTGITVVMEIKRKSNGERMNKIEIIQ